MPELSKFLKKKRGSSGREIILNATCNLPREISGDISRGKKNFALSHPLNFILPPKDKFTPWILFLLICSIGILAAQNPPGVQQNIAANNITVTRFDSLKNSINSQLEELKNFQLDRDIELAKQHIERANRIIDWTAAIFTALAILLVVAGAIGMREFSNIRSIEKSLQEKLNDIGKELLEIQNYKSDLIKETKQVVEIHYYLNEGTQAYQSSDYLKTRDMLYKVLELDPNHIEAHFFIGKSFMVEGKKVEADTIFEKILAIDARNSNAYYGLAINCVDSDVVKSIEYLNKAIEFNPRNHKALNFLGLIYRDSGKIDKALDFHKKSYAIKQTSANTFYIGLIYFVRGDLKNAKVYFDEANYLARKQLERISQWHWQYFIMGMIEGLCGKLSVARKHCKTALGYNSSIGVRKGMKRHMIFLSKQLENNQKIQSLMTYFDFHESG